MPLQHAACHSHSIGCSSCGHAEDRIAQDAQRVPTAVPEDADVDDDGDDDVVVQDVTLQMTVQKTRPALPMAATGVTSAGGALEVMVAHGTGTRTLLDIAS